MKHNCTEKLYTLSEACELLSISTATGRNWMKSGRLLSVAAKGHKPLFCETELYALKDALSLGTVSGLNSRRNKTYVRGKGAYDNYVSKDSPNQPAVKQLLGILAAEHVSLDDATLLCLLRHCATQLITSAGYETAVLFEPLLESLTDSGSFHTFLSAHPSIRKISYTYFETEDTLGYLFLSLRGLDDRKASGSYYTPARIAKQLVKNHLSAFTAEHTVFDPSCGTGIFLLQLPANHPLHHIYGNDINPICISLTRINLALKYHITTSEAISTLQKNITVSDFLTMHSGSYDVILGNPPWGAKLSTEDKKIYRKRFSCILGSSVEIFDLFIEQSLRLLTPNGCLAFVLPEAVLTVKSHTPIRNLLLTTTTLHSVEYLGEVFEQVHCPSIILSVKRSNMQPFFEHVSVMLSDGTFFTTQVERVISADSFSFTLTDNDYLLLQKIQSHPNHTTLAGKSSFALGIVTGNNTNLLHNSPAPGLEPIIKGSDISKYHIRSNSGYIAFSPEKLQQTAPEELYRAPEKLLYRFINKQLIFAYDDTGMLSLNSCNIVIPQIPGLSVKYVLAVLNSSVAQFFFEKKYHSVKVLRSHLEQIPIPLADEATQKEIVTLADKLMALDETSSDYVKTFTRLDKRIAELFFLTKEEYERICS